jgi:hypothetical protein
MTIWVVKQEDKVQAGQRMALTWRTGVDRRIRYVFLFCYFSSFLLLRFLWRSIIKIFIMFFNTILLCGPSFLYFFVMIFEFKRTSFSKN